jgi:hypothetical protein
MSVLAFIAIIAIGLGAWLNQSPSNDKFEVGLLFDDLQRLANQVNNVEKNQVIVGWQRLKQSNLLILFLKLN